MSLFISITLLVKKLLTLNILKYLHLICMFWLAHYYCDIDIPLVCHIFTQLYSLYSLYSLESPCSQDHRKECQTLKSDGRRFQDRESLLRAGEHLGNWLPILWVLHCLYCAVCNAPHCTVQALYTPQHRCDTGATSHLVSRITRRLYWAFCKDQ